MTTQARNALADTFCRILEFRYPGLRFKVERAERDSSPPLGEVRRLGALPEDNGSVSDGDVPEAA